jgi:ABC-2 type transport system permease protein
MSAVAIAPQTRTTRAVPRSIPLPRLIGVELRKMFDTRSGFWLMASIGITSLLATGAVILWAPDSELTYDTFSAAIGFPMAVILPIIAILSVTSEWSQRNGLTTFTMVPHRGRVIASKALASLVVGVVSMALAAAIGAIGNVVGTAITGTDTVWDISVAHFGLIVLGNVLGMVIGFMLGVLVRNSSAAVVTYLVYSFVLPGAFIVLAGLQQWFRDLQPWVDINFASAPLFNGTVSAEQWANLGVASLIWLVLPLAIGLRLVMRSEVK